MSNLVVNRIIDRLFQWVTNYKGRDVIKDTTKIRCNYDAYINSNATDPLSFTVFEMSDQGELLIDNVQRLVSSQAAFFLFVNTKTGWIIAVKNTDANQARLVRKEPVENFKVKIIN